MQPTVAAVEDSGVLAVDTDVAPGGAVIDRHVLIAPSAVPAGSAAGHGGWKWVGLVAVVWRFGVRRYGAVGN